MQKKLGLIGDDDFINRFKNKLSHYQVFSSNIPSVLSALMNNVTFDIILSQFDIPSEVQIPCLIVAKDAPKTASLLRQYIHQNAGDQEIIRRMEILNSFVDQRSAYERLYQYGKSHFSEWTVSITNTISKADLKLPTLMMGERGTGKHWYLDVFLRFWNIDSLAYIHFHPNFLEDVRKLEHHQFFVFSKFDQAQDEHVEKLLDFLTHHNLSSIFLMEQAPIASELQTYLTTNNLIFIPPVRKRPECIDFFVDGLFEGSPQDELENLKLQLRRYQWPGNLTDLRAAFKVYKVKGLNSLKLWIDDKIHRAINIHQDS